MAILGIIEFFAIFFGTHYVSLGSLVVYVSVEIELIVLGQLGYFQMSQAHLIELYLLGLALAIMAFWKHRENIKRLLNGTERKTYLFKNKK
jgi:glycerol-3-phosphate acyltransferase PlsY